MPFLSCSKEEPPPSTSGTSTTQTPAAKSDWDPKAAVGTWSATIERARIGDLPAPPPESDTFTFTIDDELRLDGQAPFRQDGRSLVAERDGVTMRLTWVQGSLAGEMIRKDVAVEFVKVEVVVPQEPPVVAASKGSVLVTKGTLMLRFGAWTDDFFVTGEFDKSLVEAERLKEPVRWADYGRGAVRYKNDLGLARSFVAKVGGEDWDFPKPDEPITK